MYQNNFRISDLQSSGLDKFIVDPDGSVQYAIIEEHVRENLLNISPPLLKNWTDNMTVIPENVCYTRIYGYVHTVTFLHGFVLFHNPKGIPIYFQTIENDGKTLPCAHSL